MKQIRILALDLDDTLLCSDFSISLKTRNAIKLAQKAGITIVLTSGRIPDSMDRYVRVLDLHKKPGYVVSNNGTLITESHTGNIIYESLLDPEIIMAICELAEKEGFPLQMYADNITYVSRRNEYSDMDEKVTNLRQVVVENFQALVGESCHKLIIPGDHVHLNDLLRLIKMNMGNKVSLFISRKYFLQIAPKDTNKGTALAKIADIMGCKPEQTMAIGDSMNDEAMIRWAGIGVALANATEELKEIADFVTYKTNDDNGVAEAIEKYILGI